MKKICGLILWVFLIFQAISLHAQKSLGHNALISDYRLGLELFNKEKFGAAQHWFDKVIASIEEQNSEMRINAEYYSSICAIELFNKDAGYKLTSFVKDHPESPYVKKAYFQLGRYNYRKKKWDQAIKWFSKVDLYELNNDDLGEFYFKLGYSYFRNGNEESALKSLYEIKDADTKYTLPARYYYGHISYKQGQYQTALEMFRKIESDPKFGVIVPYYITQILYLQHKYDELISYAPALLDTAIPNRATEIAHLLGDAYYKQGKFKEAIPYLEMYRKKSTSTREDEYQLAYCYYVTDDMEMAIKIFKRLCNMRDEVAQSSLYHLGDCYRRMNKQRFAMNAFIEASKLNFDAEIQEVALYNYAVLSCQTSFDPYNEAIEALNLYLQKYPNSEKSEEVFEYLVDVYSSTNDYESALKSLNKIDAPDIRLKRIYQNLQFNVAVQYFSNQKYRDALTHFKMVSDYPEDKALITKSIYWIAECEYVLNNYAEALNDYKKFIFSPGAILENNFVLAYYNAAYSAFKTGDYSEAIKWFRKFSDDNNSNNFNDQKTDALLRIADAYFINKDYELAESYYSEALGTGKLAADYALFQKSVAFGLLQHKEEKIKSLNTLLASYPNSGYADDATFFLGQAFIQDEPSKALTYFDDVLRNYPVSKYSKEALLNKGIIYHNAGDNEKALNVFNEIAQSYRSYKEAREAISYARNIYIETGNMEEFKKWISGLDYYHLTVSSLDSADYKAAYLKYVNGDFEQAALSFEKYLAEYESAIYGLKAHYYKADCDYRAGLYSEALSGYNYVIDQYPNRFTISSLLYAARINNRFGQVQEALNNYIMLEKMADNKEMKTEAEIGQMRCFSLLNNQMMAMVYADKVLGNLPHDIEIVEEAHMIKGDAALSIDSLTLALKEFAFVANNDDERSAEAQYKISEIYYQSGDYVMAENQTNILVEKKSAYKYWIAKGMILLSDIYVVKDELFQARATLKSLLKHYTGDDELIEQAKNKLAQIDTKEKEALEHQTHERDHVFEIVFDSDHFDVDSLFGEDMVKDDPLKAELIENE